MALDRQTSQVSQTGALVLLPTQETQIEQHQGGHDAALGHFGDNLPHIGVAQWLIDHC